MWCILLNKIIWPPAKFMKEIDQIIHQKIPTTKMVVYLFKSQNTPMPSKERILNYTVRQSFIVPSLYSHIWIFQKILASLTKVKQTRSKDAENPCEAGSACLFMVPPERSDFLEQPAAERKIRLTPLE